MRKMIRVAATLALLFLFVTILISDFQKDATVRNRERRAMLFAVSLGTAAITARAEEMLGRDEPEVAMAIMKAAVRLDRALLAEYPSGDTLSPDGPSGGGKGI